MIDARIPRYQQLKDMIIRRISSGDLRPADRVPSEYELVEATGVSRMTANRALRELTGIRLAKRAMATKPRIAITVVVSPYSAKRSSPT